MINLELQNTALLLKQVHKFFSKTDIPWVKLVWSLYDDSPPQAQSPRGSFWWRDVFKLVNIYCSITRAEVNNGRMTLFWKDFWHGNELLCHNYPRLYSFALNEDISVAAMVSTTEPDMIFALPLTVQAFEKREHSTRKH